MADGIRLESGGRGELLIAVDGTFRAVGADGAERTGRVDAALVRRVLGGLEDAPSPVEDPTAARRLTVVGQPGRPGRQWTDGTAAPVPAAAAVLDALLDQVFAEPGAPVALGSALALAAPVARGARTAAAVGAVGGRAAYALVNEDGSFGLTALDDDEALGGSDADAGLLPTAVALGAAAGRSLFAVGGADGSVQVWDAVTGQVAHGTTGGEGAQAVAAAVIGDVPVAFSAGQSGDLRAMRADNGRVLGALPTGGNGATVLRAAHCAGLDLLAAAGADGAVRVWNTADGEQLHLLVGHRGEVRALAVLSVADQAVLASAGQDRRIRLWDLATGQPVAELDGHTGTVTGLAFLEVDGRPVLASCALDGTVRTWDVYDGRPLRGWPAGEWLTALAVDGARLLVGDERGGITAWDAATGAALQTPPLGRTGTPVTALSRGELLGRAVLVAGFGDGTVLCWDALTATRLVEVPADGGPVNSLDVTADGPDGPLLVCGTAAGAVRAHVLRDGTPYPLPTPHAGPVAGLAFTAEEPPLLVSAGRDGVVAVRDAATGEPRLRFATGYPGTSALAVTRAGGQQILATVGADLTVRLWHGGSGRPGPVCAGLALPAEVLTFGRLGGRPVVIAGAADGTVLAWSVEDGSRIAELTGGGAAVRSLVARELDGEALLAAGDTAGTLRLWHLASGSLLNEAALEGAPLAIELDEAGVRIVTPGGAVSL
ncbi:WD40 repeat domain-containing protein [Kitasatospora terrestris]|uniref:Pyrrolo-quinoline quinone repeat domain-containing protein n=1 Tax=Kitasatospora terrestris TaxID=258051 RepID=A0ABP9DFQ9_9ACTN